MYKKLKIAILIIIVIIIILIVLLVNLKENNKTNIENIEASEPDSTPTQLAYLQDDNMYFTVKDCVQTYLNYIITNYDTLDREYETVVENILNYACDQVRIGNAEDGTPVQIDTAYPISQIVDFEGDYFAASFTDENGESDDSDPLRHIAEAEYQNLSFTIERQRS